MKKIKKGFLKKVGQGKKKGEEVEKKGVLVEKKGEEIEKKGEEAEKKGEEIEKKGEEAEKKGEEDEKKGEEGPLKGKLVRVVDESLYYCGRILEIKGHRKDKIHGIFSWKEVESSVFENTKVPASVVLSESSVLELSKIEKPALTPWKSLRFKDEERAEAEDKFIPDELETGHKLAKDDSLPLIHMEMWLWLMVRDFELKKIERIKLLSPSKMSAVCKEMQRPDAAERFVEQVGTLGAELQAKKLILMPVWGDSPEHWTLVIVDKGEDDKWMVKYKDSLTNPHKECWENAEKLVTLISCALMQELKFPAERCNTKKQPKGSLECGFFVCHWIEQSIREELKEGPFPTGLPNVGRVHDRLANMQHLILKNKGWSAMHKEKAAKVKESLEKKRIEEEKKLAEVVKSKEYQEMMHKEAKIKTLIPWVTLSGCAKCRFAVNGSTCCNPEKMLAKELALKESADGKFDKKIYEQKLVEVYENLKKDHISPLAVTKLPHKGGGGEQDIRKKTGCQ